MVLCGRSSDRTRADSPRQLPTDHDYAVSTREYQSDSSSLPLGRSADRVPTACAPGWLISRAHTRSAIEEQKTDPGLLTTVFPYQSGVGCST